MPAAEKEDNGEPIPAVVLEIMFPADATDDRVAGSTVGILNQLPRRIAPQTQQEAPRVHLNKGV